MQSLRLSPRKGGIDMTKIKQMVATLLMIGWVTFLATPAFAKSFSMKDAGISLWIFLIIGAIIILLQLIPAVILFFSFIGTGTAMAFGRKKVAEKEGATEEDKPSLSGYGPVRAEK